MHRTLHALAVLASTMAACLSPQAARAAWTALPIPPGIDAYVAEARACKRSLSSIYGPLWSVNYQVFRRDPRANAITVYSLRLPAVSVNSSQRNYNWLYGSVAGTGNQVYASPFYDDRFNFHIEFSSQVYFAAANKWISGIGIAYLKPSQIANC